MILSPPTLIRVDSDNSVTMKVDSDDYSHNNNIHHHHHHHKPHATVARRVRFAEAQNCYYATPAEAIARPDLRWYQEDDYQAFAYQVRRDAMALQDSKWAADWIAVYYTLRLEPHKIADKLQSMPRLTMPDFAVGMHDRSMESLYADFHLRRASLLTHVYNFQHAMQSFDNSSLSSSSSSSSQAASLEHLLSDTSKTHSHAARLYANLAAVVLAASLQE